MWWKSVNYVGWGKIDFQKFAISINVRASGFGTLPLPPN